MMDRPPVLRAYFADLAGYDCAECLAPAQPLDDSDDGHRSFIAHAADCPAVHRWPRAQNGPKNQESRAVRTRDTREIAYEHRISLFWPRGQS